MSRAEYFRDWRSLRRVRGTCAECPAKSAGYRCRACAIKRAARKKWRNTAAKAA